MRLNYQDIAIEVKHCELLPQTIITRDGREEEIIAVMASKAPFGTNPANYIVAITGDLIDNEEK